MPWRAWLRIDRGIRGLLERQVRGVCKPQQGPIDCDSPLSDLTTARLTVSSPCLPPGGVIRLRNWQPGTTYKPFLARVRRRWLGAPGLRSSA